MIYGIICALVAGMMWGLAFIGPILIPEYPAIMHTIGRYMAFGLISLVPAWFCRNELKALKFNDWIDAVKLTLIGNFVYYLLLSSSIQFAGAPLPTVIIGTLPVMVAIAANLRNYQRDGLLPWRHLSVALLMIFFGIACVNQAEIRTLTDSSTFEYDRYLLGASLAAGAVVCWTWYALKNGDWMRMNDNRNSRTWATAQGLVTLPIALLSFLSYLIWSSISMPEMSGTQLLGQRPLVFVSLMITIGLFSSFIATMCWNAACKKLPIALVGQLIVFETLAALFYAFLLRGSLPSLIAIIGIGMLLIGVVIALRIRPVAGT